MKSQTVTAAFPPPITPSGHPTATLGVQFHLASPSSFSAWCLHQQLFFPLNVLFLPFLKKNLCYSSYSCVKSFCFKSILSHSQFGPIFRQLAPNLTVQFVSANSLLPSQTSYILPFQRHFSYLCSLLLLCYIWRYIIAFIHCFSWGRTIAFLFVDQFHCLYYFSYCHTCLLFPSAKCRL